MANKGNRAGEGPAKKKGGLLRRMGTLALVLCAVLAVVVLTTMEDGRHFASLRRWLMYGESSGSRDVYVYAADPANRYGRVGDSLLVVSPNTAQMIGDDGAIAFEQRLNMSSPQLTVGARQAAVCDVGGDTLYLMDQSGVRRTMSTEKGLCYYSARLNGSDYLAVTEQKSGYKATVSVYGSQGELKFHFDSYDNYISDAAVTEDCRSVVMVSLETQEGTFAARLLAYSLDTAEQIGSAVIRDGLALDIRCVKNRVQQISVGSSSPPWTGRRCWTVPTATCTSTTTPSPGTASAPCCWDGIRRATSAPSPPMIWTGRSWPACR